MKKKKQTMRLMRHNKKYKGFVKTLEHLGVGRKFLGK